MAFKTWHEYVTFREDNARKRAVKAALNGTGSRKVASMAVCPGATNPRAVASVEKFGDIRKDESEAKPDYSMDRWVKKAQEFGDDVNKLVGHGEAEEAKIDKKEKEVTDKETKEKKTKVPAEDKKTGATVAKAPESGKSVAKAPTVGKEKEPDFGDKKPFWEKLKELARERAAEKAKKDKKNESPKNLQD